MPDFLSHARGHGREVLGSCAESDLDVAGAALRQRLRQADGDGVGLPQIFAQDVAQRDVQHRRRGDDLFLLHGID